MSNATPLAQARAELHRLIGATPKGLIPAIGALVAAAKAKGRAEERERLKPLAAFGRWCLSEMREDGGGDIDGGAAQDKAEALGALIRVPVTGPCGKGCACAEYYGEFPADCLRENPALTHSPETLAAIQAGLDAARSGRVTPVTFVDHVSPTTEDRDAG